MIEHPLSPATRTVELEQLAEIGRRLAEAGAPTVTAADLAMDDPALPASAVLTHVAWEGPPEYPYIHAHFSGAPSNAPVQLHTEALRRLSAVFGLHHRWGV